MTGMSDTNETHVYKLLTGADWKAASANGVTSAAIDKTDGCLVYLSKEAMGAQFVTSKSSEMNVAYPGPNDEMLETPIPEQFVHNVILNGDKPRMSAEISDLYS